MTNRCNHGGSWFLLKCVPRTLECSSRLSRYNKKIPHLSKQPGWNQVNFLVRAFDMDKSNSVDYSEFCKTMDLTDSELVRLRLF